MTVPANAQKAKSVNFRHSIIAIAIALTSLAATTSAHANVHAKNKAAWEAVKAARKAAKAAKQTTPAAAGGSAPMQGSPINILPESWDTASAVAPTKNASSAVQAKSEDPLAPIDHFESTGQTEIKKTMASKPLIDLDGIHLPKPPAVYHNDRQVDCIASAIHYEARGEPKKGQIAVAEVILARVQSKKFAKTPCAVVAQRKQFSFVRGGYIPSVPYKHLEAMRQMARKVMSGELRTRVRGALYFHAARIRPNWGTQLAGRIGNHIFYMK